MTVVLVFTKFGRVWSIFLNLVPFCVLLANYFSGISDPFNNLVIFLVLASFLCVRYTEVCGVQAYCVSTPTILVINNYTHYCDTIYK